MGAQIEAVVTTHSREGIFGKRALGLADDAAKACLRQAGREAHELDLLINAGIYRDENLGEPALAALIQQDIGANPRHPTGTGHGTFSFDVANGGCGVLTGVQILDGFLRSGSVRLGMVVASDANPGRAVRRGFPFPRVGGALLLGPGAEEKGFTHFHFESFPEFEDLFESRVSWRRGRFRWLPGARSGRNVLAVEEKEGYRNRCVDCAEESASRFLRRMDLKAADVDLLVASRSPIGFADELADRLGIPTYGVAEVGEELEGAHTAGPLVALEAAMRSGQFQEAKQVLFAAVGAGIVVGLALYQK
jgi:3-oxoacyl-[acyl-carrier-protein] synthase-3